MNSILKLNFFPITQIQVEILDYSSELTSFCELLEEKLEGRKSEGKSEDSRN